MLGEAITQAQLAEYINKEYGSSLKFRNMTVDEYIQDRKSALGEFLGSVFTKNQTMNYHNIRKPGMEKPLHFILEKK